MLPSAFTVRLKIKRRQEMKTTIVLSKGNFSLHYNPKDDSYWIVKGDGQNRFDWLQRIDCGEAHREIALVEFVRQTECY